MRIYVPPTPRRLSRYWYQSFGTRRKPSGQASKAEFKAGRQALVIHKHLCSQKNHLCDIFDKDVLRVIWIENRAKKP